MNEPTEAAVVRMLIAELDNHGRRWRDRYPHSPLAAQTDTKASALRAVMKAAGWSLEDEGDEQR